MNISLTDWIKFKNTLSAISTKASDELVDWLQKRGGYLNVDMDELISYAYALATKYGEASASLTAEMYDEIAELSGVIVPSAEVAETVSFSEIAKAINGVTKKTTTDSNVASVVGRYVKRTAEDTTLNNAERDGAQFAWVPSGDTCAFCITLASRGWQYMSKKARKNGHASHIHANCDCTYAIRFDDKTEIEGYDPQVYKDMYYGAEGNTPQERINSMRRIQYQSNKENINEQKRKNYHIKTINGKIEEVKQYAGVDTVTLVSEAKQGKKYGGVIKQSEQKTENELRKSIFSHVKVAEEHTNKIQSPSSYSEKYDNLNDEGKQGMIKHWERDRRRNSETAIIEAEVYNERFGNGEGNSSTD